MSIKRHGFSVGLQRGDKECYLNMSVFGKLTHDDYLQMSPFIHNALQGIEKGHVSVLLDIRDFDGCDLRAAWDDFRLVLKEGKKFNRIAIFGSTERLKRFSTIARWFVSGEIQFFEDEDVAIAWLYKKDS